MPRASLIILCILFALPLAFAQDAATGAIHGTVVDLHDLRIPGATIAAVNTAPQRATHHLRTPRPISMAAPPGDFSRVFAAGMSPQVTPQMHVDVGASAELEFLLTIAGIQEKVTVSGTPQLVDTQPSAVSSLVDERAIADLPQRPPILRSYAALARRNARPSQPDLFHQRRSLFRRACVDSRTASWSMAATSTMPSSPRPAVSIALLTSSRTKSSRSSASPRTHTAPSKDAPAARSST